MSLSADLLQGIFDSAASGLAILEVEESNNQENIDFTILYVNDAASNYFQMEKEFIIGKKFMELSGMEDKKVVLNLLRSVYQDGNPQSMYANLKTDKGSLREKQYYIASSKHEEYVSIMWHKAEKSLGENFHSNLFENWTAPSCVLELLPDNEGKDDLRILAANREFAKHISADFKTLPGKLFTEVCYMDMEWLPFYVQAAETGVGSLYESFDRDKKKFLSTLVYSPKQGQVALIIMDRTHVWEEEQLLKTKGNDLSLIFSTMSSGICMGKIIRDKEGNPSEVIYEIVNSAFEMLEGYPTATLQGKRFGEEEPDYSKYVEVVERKNKKVFTKKNELNNLVVEVVCFSPAEDVVVCIENDITERVETETAFLQAYEMIGDQNKTILSSIDYASKIQRNLLPRTEVFEHAFQDYSVIWEPRDVVGGDIYWIKTFEEGTVFCLCDCTGHGIPGAILTMLVTATFETMIKERNYKDTAQIIWMLEQRFVHMLNVNADEANHQISDGCDLAVLFIANDGSVSISAGNTHVFICDGKEVQQIKGQKIYVGEGKIKSKEDVKVVHIPANPNNKFYLASDGLFDQCGRIGERVVPFGYRTFKKILLENHQEKQEVISEKIWDAFEKYRGEELRRDDVELVTFKPYTL